MKINEYTKEIESMTEEEAEKKFGSELVEKLLRIGAEYASEDQWYLKYTASIAIPNHNASLQVTYTVDKEECEDIELEEDYDWSNYQFSVPSWDDDEEEIWQSEHAK